MLLMTTNETNRAVLALRRRAREVGLGQAQLGAEVGRVQGWVSSRLYFDPDATLRHLAYKDPPALQRLLTALRWTLQQLNEATGLEIPLAPSSLSQVAPHEPSSDLLLIDGVQINVYGAGTGPAWGDTDILETLYIPGLKPDRDYIGLRATGDSMSPYLSKGEVAVIHRDEGSVQPGDYAAVWLSNDGCVIKRLVQELDDGTLLLESLNPPDGEPRYFQAPDGSRVLGKVIHRLLKG